MRTILVIFIGISFFLIFLFNLNQTADAHNQAGCNAENEGDTCYYQGENYCCGSDYCNTQFEGECTQYDDGEGTIHSHCNFVTSIPPARNHAACVTECRTCYAGDTQTETRYDKSCLSSTCSASDNTCARYVIVQERSRTCNDNCGGWGGWSGWSNTGEEYPECASDGSCGDKNSSGSSCYVAPGCTESACGAWTNNPDTCGGGSCTSTQKPQTRTCPGGSTCYTSRCNPDSSCGGGGG